MPHSETTNGNDGTMAHLEPLMQRRLSGERSPKDYVIEFGGYLANEAEGFMAEVNRSQETGEHIDRDIWNGLQSAIYEFRKHAKRGGA